MRFWTVIGVITDTLLVTALVFRIAGLVVTDNTRSDFYHVLSFRVLSCVAPLIWCVRTKSNNLADWLSGCVRLCPEQADWRADITKDC